MEVKFNFSSSVPLSLFFLSKHTQKNIKIIILKILPYPYLIATIHLIYDECYFINVQPEDDPNDTQRSLQKGTIHPSTPHLRHQERAPRPAT